MLFGDDEDLELQPKRTKTVMISVGIHLALIVFLIFNPDLLTSPPKRIIKVMGQDYDLSKEELTELVMPPKPAVPDKPLVQPPAPKPTPQPEQQQTPPPPQPQPQPQAAPPPPPPPPPPPKPQPPPPVIGPDDVIKEGARPDAGPNRAARGNTTEQARNGSQDTQPKPEQQPKPAQQAQTEKEQLPPIALNRNPNSLQTPGGNIMDSARKAVDQQTELERRRASSNQGPRTGLPQGQEDPDFATEEPTILSDTKGYDFGPYMNGVVNRVRSNWYALIPEIARLGKRGKVVIIFTITKNGTIANMRQAANSGTEALDRAAYGSITASNPFAQLPAGFDGDHLDLQFTFLYNIR